MDTDSERCIWCTNPTTPDEPEEHILGEGLVGEQPFRIGYSWGEPTKDAELVLRDGEVCGDCNGRNGRLDEYLQKQLGFMKVFFNPVGTNTGRPATAQMPGMYAERRSDGVEITFNANDYTVQNPRGVYVGPGRQKPSALRVDKFTHGDGIGRITVSHPISLNKRMSRALHKIGFELLCFQQGRAFVLDPRFDPIREYVLHGRGSRRAAFSSTMKVAGSWESPSLTMHKLPVGPDWYGELRFGLTFYVDLSPESLFLNGFDPAECQRQGLIVRDDATGFLTPGSA